MANLRPQRTGLPFVVWVSQRGRARHDVRVKVARGAKVPPSEMGSYSVRPFGFVDGARLDPTEERLLADWVHKNRDILIDFWHADIEYTEDFIDKVQRV